MNNVVLLTSVLEYIRDRRKQCESLHDTQLNDVLQSIEHHIKFSIANDVITDHYKAKYNISMKATEWLKRNVECGHISWLQDKIARNAIMHAYRAGAEEILGNLPLNNQY